MKPGGWIYVCCAAVNLVACSQTKTLKEGQYLYKGPVININSPEKITRRKKAEIKSELEDLLRPKPNGKFLGIPFKLLIYNSVGEPKRKGLSYWLKNKVGEPPVLGSVSAFKQNRIILQNRLENIGYFKDSVKLDTVTRKLKIQDIYTVTTGYQYTIRNVVFPEDSSILSREIQKFKKQTLLKTGTPYDLDLIKNERVRIDSRLKENGFYNFSPDYLLVIVDSTVGKHQVDMRVVVIRSTPESAKAIYTINDVVIYANFSINADTALPAKPTIWQGYTIIDPGQLFKPSLFSNTLVYKLGSTYNITDQNLSLSRLINLGVFKFVKLNFKEVDSIHYKLNIYYYLTRAQKRSLVFQVSGLTQSDNSYGGALTISARNKNAFRGAELFVASIYGGLETQNLGGGQFTNIFKLGADLNLYIPRIISPVTIHNIRAFMPKTRINLGYLFYNSTNQYTLNSFKTSYGYVWKRSEENEIQLNLININYVNPTNITPQFQLQLDTNLTLARSIERQFIIGPSYNYNYNTQLSPIQRDHNFYFNANIDLSANVIGWVTGADYKTGNVKEIFNTPFSQYIRGALDFRYYLNFSPTTVLANRIWGGVGFAYGNSSTMPFIKEFFAGGPNDIRAFQSNTLGPGTYYAGNRDTAYIANQPGDIKMEINTELRFKIVSVLHWAFFVDAGNIWTRLTDSTRPGSQITPQFYQQIAVGIGTGLRIDFGILVIRFDLAVPVREPYRPAGSQWYFDGKNRILNFAIGYPF
jgi:outer membrane protein insertion porin family